jgi:hypothetical protein
LLLDCQLKVISNRLKIFQFYIDYFLCSLSGPFYLTFSMLIFTIKNLDQTVSPSNVLPIKLGVHVNFVLILTMGINRNINETKFVIMKDILIFDNVNLNKLVNTFWSFQSSLRRRSGRSIYCDMLYKLISYWIMECSLNIVLGVSDQGPPNLL